MILAEKKSAARDLAKHTKTSEKNTNTSSIRLANTTFTRFVKIKTNFHRCCTFTSFLLFLYSFCNEHYFKPFFGRDREKFFFPFVLKKKTLKVFIEPFLTTYREDLVFFYLDFGNNNDFVNKNVRAKTLSLVCFCFQSLQW